MTERWKRIARQTSIPPPSAAEAARSRLASGSLATSSVLLCFFAIAAGLSPVQWVTGHKYRDADEGLTREVKRASPGDGSHIVLCALPPRADMARLPRRHAH